MDRFKRCIGLFSGANRVIREPQTTAWGEKHHTCASRHNEATGWRDSRRDLVRQGRPVRKNVFAATVYRRSMRAAGDAHAGLERNLEPRRSGSLADSLPAAGQSGQYRRVLPGSMPGRAEGVPTGGRAKLARTASAPGRRAVSGPSESEEKGQAADIHIRPAPSPGWLATPAARCRGCRASQRASSGARAHCTQAG